jgi:hypothetical protein
MNFPQLVDGGDWSSDITVLNLSDTPLILTFSAFQENGALFIPPALTNNTVPRTLAPRAILKTSAAEVFGFRQDITQVGWLQVEANDAGLTGFVAYGTRSNPTRAVVAAQHTPVTRAVFSHQAEAAGFFTGLAVLNASALTANVEIFSVNADGSLRGRTKQAFKPNQRQSKLLREWVPAAEGAAGGYILLRIVPVVDPDGVGGKVTITISGSSKLVVKHLEGSEAGKTETISVTTNLTFAGTTLINGKFLPSNRVLFDIGGIVPDSFGSLSGTLSFSNVISGSQPETGSFTFSGQ